MLGPPVTDTTNEFKRAQLRCLQLACWKSDVPSLRDRHSKVDDEG
jgi:hypothetical protein